LEVANQVPGKRVEPKLLNPLCHDWDLGLGFLHAILAKVPNSQPRRLDDLIGSDCLADCDESDLFGTSPRTLGGKTDRLIDPLQPLGDGYLLDLSHDLPRFSPSAQHRDRREPTGPTGLRAMRIESVDTARRADSAHKHVLVRDSSTDKLTSIRVPEINVPAAPLVT
jgi:hypothetical protein